MQERERAKESVAAQVITAAPLRVRIAPDGGDTPIEMINKDIASLVEDGDLVVLNKVGKRWCLAYRYEEVV